MLQLGEVDKASDTPAFKQIAEALRFAIHEGVIAPGERVPSESQLMEHFGVARMTVRQALAELRGEGLTFSDLSCITLVTTRGEGVEDGLRIVGYLRRGGDLLSAEADRG